MFDNANKSTRRLLVGWLSLSVLSLVFAGLFALLIVLARTPGVESVFAVGRDYIYVALVGHVVLAFVIWFLAFEGFLWVYTTTVGMGRELASTTVSYAALAVSGAGMALVIISAVLGLGGAELSNYVPVLLTSWFFAGLVLFFLGIALNIAGTFAGVIRARLAGATLPAPAFGMVISGVAVLTALLCFAVSWGVQASGGGGVQMERLFWGGGHALQFANTVSIVAAWLILAERVSGPGSLIGDRAAKGLFLVYLLFIIPHPFVYLFSDISASGHGDAFTSLMRWGHWPSTVVFIICAVAMMLRRSERPWRDPSFSALMLSMLIIVIGGLIGADIRGTNTKIPAHYHSMIVAVTIAFMAVFYEAMAHVGRRVWSVKLSRVQPWLYSIGIILFVAGLYVAGSDGMERKAMAGAQNLDTFWKTFGMALMGFGGFVAISGGVTFVLNGLISILCTGARGGAQVGIAPTTAGDGIVNGAGRVGDI